MAVVKEFHREASARVRVDGELIESFPIGIRLRQGCLLYVAMAV